MGFQDDFLYGLPIAIGGQALLFPPGSEGSEGSEEGEGDRAAGILRGVLPSAPTLISIFFNRVHGSFGKGETTVGEGCNMRSCRSKLSVQRKIKIQRLTHHFLPIISINR